MQEPISGVKYANQRGGGVSRSTIAFLIVVLAYLTGCGERTEGCLDTAATNFEVDADRNCCCEYPQLLLEIFPRTDTIDDAAFRANDTVRSDVDTFIVRQVRFVLSGFEMVRSDDTVARGQDSITLPLVDGTSFITTDDFVATRLSTFNYPVGTIESFGAYDSLRFTVGILPPANRAEPLSLPSGHPLADTTLFDDDVLEYLTANIVVTPDLAADSINVNYPLRVTRSVTVPVSFTAEESEDLQVNLRFYYSYLFEGIDFGEMSELEITQQLQQNLTRVFVR